MFVKRRAFQIECIFSFIFGTLIFMYSEYQCLSRFFGQQNYKHQMQADDHYVFFWRGAVLIFPLPPFPLFALCSGRGWPTLEYAKFSFEFRIFPPLNPCRRETSCVELLAQLVFKLQYHMFEQSFCVLPYTHVFTVLRGSVQHRWWGLYQWPRCKCAKIPFMFANGKL